MSETDQRQREAASWAARTMGVESVRLTPVSGEASFRRYFRFFMGRRSIILMDAPPEKEDSAPFVEIAGRLRCAGLQAPEILYLNLEWGFGLLEDFGDTLYRELISDKDHNLTPLAAEDAMVVVVAERTRGSQQYSAWGVDGSAGVKRWQFNPVAQDYDDGGSNAVHSDGLWSFGVSGLCFGT